MRILLTGSTGFIGSTLMRTLIRAGHSVRGCVSPRHHQAPNNSIVVDFARDTAINTWMPRLSDTDVVINAVGVLRNSRSNPIDAVHCDTPKALFSACAQAGIGQVIQISALGVAQGNTRYALTKRAADEHLLGLAQQHPHLEATVLRPSVVFGKGADSSTLFMQLASLPVAVFPGPMLDAQIQPISVFDLAQAVVELLAKHHKTSDLPAGLSSEAQPTTLGALEASKILECTGPQALTMGDFVASLRQQRGYSPAKVLRLPPVLTKLSARMGDMVPGVPWCTEALHMLAIDNTGNHKPLEQILGRPLIHYSQLLAQAWRDD